MPKNKTYVLVHGAWHGGWCWDRLSPILKAQGNIVFAPDLPGHGLDDTPFSTITMATYVDFVMDLINKQKEPVVLVGHSMAGIVISQIAEYIPERIDHLVYVAAFVPDDNGSLVQEGSKAKGPGFSSEMVFDADSNEVSLKLSKQITSHFYNTCNSQDVGWALRHLQKQPFRPFVDPVKISDERFGRVPKLYIECLKDEAILLEDQRRMHEKLNCKVVSMDTDHSPFISDPEKLSEILLNIDQGN